MTWRHPPTSTMINTGDPWAPEWFPGGRLNLLDSVLHKGLGLPALSWEDETGRRTTWTHDELRRLTLGLAHTLHLHGVDQRSVVGTFMPAQPGAVMALLAPAALGATCRPMFSGLGPQALRARGEGVTHWITTNMGVHKGAEGHHRSRLVAAGMRNVLVEPCRQASHHMRGARTVESERPWLQLATSGTTGAPKQVTHRHGPWMIKTLDEVTRHLDVGPGDRVCWITDPGWVVFPWIVTGTLAARARLHLLEGHPTAERVWGAVQDQRLTHLGITPSLARALREQEPAPADRWDLGYLRVIGSSGEPWDRETWEWITSALPDRHMANVSGGTEIGTLILAPKIGRSVAPCSVGEPADWMFPIIIDGELCLTEPWPTMPRDGLDQWVKADGLWHHGDAATIENDEWFLHGRVDDVLNLHGRRVHANEVEAAAMHEPNVIAAAATDHTLFVITHDGHPTGALEAVRARLGAALTPPRALAVSALPRTPSGKLQRQRLPETP